MRMAGVYASARLYLVPGPTGMELRLHGRRVSSYRSTARLCWRKHPEGRILFHAVGHLVSGLATLAGCRLPSCSGSTDRASMNCAELPPSHHSSAGLLSWRILALITGLFLLQFAHTRLDRHSSRHRADRRRIPWPISLLRQCRSRRIWPPDTWPRRPHEPARMAGAQERNRHPFCAIQLRRRSSPWILRDCETCRTLGQQHLRILFSRLRNATRGARRQSRQRTRQSQSSCQSRQTLPERPGGTLRDRSRRSRKVSTTP